MASGDRTDPVLMHLGFTVVFQMTAQKKPQHAGGLKPLLMMNDLSSSLCLESQAHFLGSVMIGYSVLHLVGSSLVSFLLPFWVNSKISSRSGDKAGERHQASIQFKSRPIRSAITRSLIRLFYCIPTDLFAG